MARQILRRRRVRSVTDAPGVKRDPPIRLGSGWGETGPKGYTPAAARAIRGVVLLTRQGSVVARAARLPRTYTLRHPVALSRSAGGSHPEAHQIGDVQIVGLHAPDHVPLCLANLDPGRHCD